MQGDANWQTLSFSNPEVQAMFKKGKAHYGLAGGVWTHTRSSIIHGFLIMPRVRGRPQPFPACKVNGEGRAQVRGAHVVE